MIHLLAILGMAAACVVWGMLQTRARREAAPPPGGSCGGCGTSCDGRDGREPG